MSKSKLHSKLHLDNQNDILKEFDWGQLDNNWLKAALTEEFTKFNKGQYQVDFEVEKDDIVFDFGASVGPFIWQIQKQKPSKVVAIEPCEGFISTLVDNCQATKLNCEIFKVGVGSTSGKEFIRAYDVKEGKIISEGGTYPTLTFMDIVKNANVDKIDFLKTDCEGGEYNIFNDSNFWWIKENVKKIVGEWHIKYYLEEFKIFRDTYLRLFPKIKLYSTDMFEIPKDFIFTQDFLDYYNQVIVYIDNR